MKPFLQAVAQDIYRRFGDDLSRTAVIFPGKRAGLWMDRFLYECAEHPLWSPAYITIDDLFDSLSALHKESQIRMACMLHDIFCRLTGSTEPLDDFYYWGELMIADFDDIELCAGVHHADALTCGQCAVKDTDENDDTEVRVVVGVEDERLQRCIGITLGRGNVGDDVLKDLTDV